MKKLFLPLLLLLTATAWGQSKSYQTLKDHFAHQPDVHAFSVSGWLCRTALSLAMEEDDDHELRVLKKAMVDIDHIRFIVIPKEEFRAQGLTVKGFRSYLHKDSFELLADIKDTGGEQVTFYMRTDESGRNRYFVLVDDADEVVGIEMKGYIDPAILESEQTRASLHGK